jgi:hypothetical protein
MAAEDRFRREVIAFAEYLRCRLDDKSDAFGIVFEAIETADIALGVFPDPNSPNGYEMRVIKGDIPLEEIVARAGRHDHGIGVVAGIPCDHLGEAERWRWALVNCNATRH